MKEQEGKATRDDIDAGATDAEVEVALMHAALDDAGVPREGRSVTLTVDGDLSVIMPPGHELIDVEIVGGDDK